MKRDTDDSRDDLEFFEGKRGRWGDERVTIIQTRDLIYFNTAFSRKAKLNKETYVRLGYSPKRKEIVLDFTEDPKAPGAYGVSQKGKNSYGVACRSFFRAYDFDKKEIVGCYIPRKERIPKVGECWVIRLNEKVEK